MKEVITFLTQLQQNNNRVWFNEHKEEYQQAQARFNGFVEKLIKNISEFDNSIVGLTPKDCIYRIYRDIRFSSDKSPYKCHMGAYINPGGKKSGYAGYYFQVGATDEGFPNGNLLAVGDYCYDPKVMRILREDICNGDGDFDRIVKQSFPFTVDTEGMLKRNPSGFAADAPYPEYIRLKTFCLCYQSGRKFMSSPDLLEETTKLFRQTKPFLEYVNRAISFVKEGY